MDDTLTILGQYMDGHKHTAPPPPPPPPPSEYPEILRYSDHPGTVHGWPQARCTPLSEYPEIPRYSDHPGTVHGWPQARCTPLSEYPKNPRYSDHPGTVHGYMDGHMHTATPCHSIPRSRDTLTILG